jgi:hypothetical protein
MEKQKISFKPLHEGMGFHPFSDGLPYAPESKAKYQNGTGANAAGRPQFISQTINPSGRTPIKTARQLQTATPQARPAPAVKAKAPELKPVATSSLIRKRAFAYLLDSILHAGFWIATNLAALVVFKFQFDAEIVRESLGQFIAFLLISQWIFIALQEVLFETTLGKTFFNLEFKRNHKSLFLRSFVFMLGALFFGMGLVFRPQDKLGEIQLRTQETL